MISTILALAVLAQADVYEEGVYQGRALVKQNCVGANLTCAVASEVETITVTGSGTGACGANTWASSLNNGAAPTCTQPAFSNLSGTATVSQGGTGAAPGADDQILVADSTSAATWRAVPNCTDSSGNHLNYTASSNTFSCGTTESTVPATGACTNQFVRGVNGASAPTCAGIGVNDFTANQGTTTTLLHGNASGQPAYTAVVDGDVSGQIGLSHGGTNANITAANGAVVYSTASALGVTAAGTSGQVLQSAGAASPTWVSDLHVLYSNAGADETHSSSTANGVTGLSFTQATSTKYMLDCNLLLTNTATSATRLAVSTGNSGDTVNCGFQHVTTSLTAAVFANEPTARWASTCTGCTTSVTSSVSATTQYAHLLCSIVTAGTGTIQVFAGASTNGQINVVKGGSHCTWYAAGL